MTVLKEELQKIILKTCIALEKKKTVAVNPKTVFFIRKLFDLDKYIK